MEGGFFGLRRFVDFTEHFAGAGKVEPRVRNDMPRGGEHVMRAVDVRVERGELVLERVAHKALSCEVIDLLRLNGGEHLEQARIAFE